MRNLPLSEFRAVERTFSVTQGPEPHMFAAFIRGWQIFRDEGVSVVKCPGCGEVIRFSRTRAGWVVFTCLCGRNRGHFPESLTDAQKARILMALAKRK